MKNVVIAGYARSPFHFAKKGALARVRPDELAAQVVAALVERSKIDPKEIEDVIMGCAIPEGEQGLNIGRIVAFLAHLPLNVAGTTVNRFCGSSMQAIHMAAGAIQLDAGEAFICAGIESMTRVPMTGFNPSPLTDGAAAVLVTTEDYAKRNNLPILARLKSFAVAGCAPELMGIGPVPAAQKALKRAGLAIKDIDIVEINEAFASQAIACMRELGIDEGKANLDGGAIALGHPLGATGARITGKAAALLKREGKRYALATQCIGGGQGIATILESA